jgi:hypothetical protein
MAGGMAAWLVLSHGAAAPAPAAPRGGVTVPTALEAPVVVGPIGPSPQTDPVSAPAASSSAVLSPRSPHRSPLSPAPPSNCAPGDPLCNAGRSVANANCDPPYYFNANGEKLFKRECL